MRAHRAYGNAGRYCEPLNFGSPSVLRCSHVTVFRSPLSSTITPSRPASVLPVPVLARSSPLRPSAIARQTWRWNANAFQPRDASQRSTAARETGLVAIRYAVYQRSGRLLQRG